MLRRRFYIAPFVFALIVSACGSDTSLPVTPDTENTPVDRVPTTLSLVAGSDQTARPGEAVSVALAVRVNNAAGQPVAGISVTFSVDSGEGVIEGASAQTDKNGIARVGRWRLGPKEGRQVAIARAAGLPDVRFTAMSIEPTFSFPPEDINETGKTIVLRSQGNPFDGLTLDIPSGAISEPTTIEFQTGSSVQLTLPPGATVESPLLTITSSTQPLRGPLILRIPLPQAPTRNTVVVVKRGVRWEALPTITMDASSITVALAEFANGDEQASLTQLRSDNSTEERKGLDIVLAKMFEASIALDRTTNYRPGSDDWAFARQLLWAPPSLNRGANIDPAESMVATSLWYFENRRATDGPLSGRFEVAPGIPESNRKGIRWVALYQPTFFRAYSNSKFATELQAAAQADPVKHALIQFHSIKWSMGLFGDEFDEPTPVSLIAGSSPDAPRIGIAFRTVGDRLDLAIPDAPGQVFSTSFTSDGMTPFSVTTSGGGTFTVTSVASLGRFDYWDLGKSWPSVVDGSLFDGLWPDLTVRAEGQTSTEAIDLDPEDVVVGPTVLHHWWRCAACAPSGFAGALAQGIMPPENRTMVFRRAQRLEGGSWGPLEPTPLSGSAFLDRDLEPALMKSQGIALYAPSPGSAPTVARAPAWIDWRSIRYRRLPISVSPEQVVTTRDTTVTYNVVVQNPPATALRYRWIFNLPESLVDTVETAVPTLTRNFTKPGEGGLQLQLVEHATGRLLANATGRVQYEIEESPHWRLTTMADLDGLGSSSQEPLFVLLATAVANPNSAMLAVDEAADGTTTLRLRVLSSGWDTHNCCIPGGAPLPGETSATLGVNPTQTFALGPYFAGFGEAFWNQSTTNLKSGTMRAQNVLGTYSYNVRNGGTQIGPRLFMGFASTRNGSVMTGTMTVQYWPISAVRPGETLPYVNPPEVLRFPFTATRIR